MGYLFPFMENNFFHFHILILSYPPHIYIPLFVRSGSDVIVFMQTFFTVEPCSIFWLHLFPYSLFVPSVNITYISCSLLCMYYDCHILSL